MRLDACRWLTGSSARSIARSLSLAQDSASALVLNDLEIAGKPSRLT